MAVCRSDSISAYANGACPKLAMNTAPSRHVTAGRSFHRPSSVTDRGGGSVKNGGAYLMPRSTPFLVKNT